MSYPPWLLGLKWSLLNLRGLQLAAVVEVAMPVSDLLQGKLVRLMCLINSKQPPLDLLVVRG